MKITVVALSCNRFSVHTEANGHSFRRSERVWFIFSHNNNRDGYDEASFIDNVLSQAGTKLDEVRSIDAGAYQYQMR